MLAARYDHLKIVEYLQNAGASVDHEDKVSGVCKVGEVTFVGWWAERV